MTRVPGGPGAGDTVHHDSCKLRERDAHYQTGYGIDGLVYPKVVFTDQEIVNQTAIQNYTYMLIIFFKNL
jgi:hypothetical protein